GDCLESVRGLADEMIVVDTGSTDRTVEIAEKFGARIFHYKWHDDFGKARNFSLSHARGDWIIVMDGDEVFDSASIWKFRKFIETAGINNPLSPRIINYIDEQNNTTEHFHCRIFPNTGKFIYKGVIHEQLLYQDGTEPPIYKLPDVIIHHYGYTKTRYKEKGKRERNIKLLRKQIQKEKKNPFHYYNMQTLHYIDNNYDKSLSCFHSVKKYSRKTEPFLPNAYVMATSSFIHKGNINKAVELAQEVLKFAPALPDVNYINAFCHYKLKNYTIALDFCRKALDKDRKTSSLVTDSGTSGWKTHHLMGEIYFNMERWADALNYYLKAFEYNQKDLPLIINIARCYEYLDIPDRALEYYQKAVSLGSGAYPFFIEYMADFIENIHGIKEALTLLEQYVNIFPEHQHINLRKGELLRKAGEYREAIRIYTMVIGRLNERTKPYEGLIYLNRGICYYHSGDKHMAEEDFIKSIDIEPGNINPYINLSYIYIDTGRPQKAIEYLIKIENIDDLTVILALAEAYIGTDRIQKAFELLNKIPSYEKDEFIRATFMKSDYYMSVNELQKAYDIVMELMAAYPSELEIYRYLIRILIARENFTTALSIYDCLLQINPDDVSVLFQKGKLCAFLHKYREAKIIYSRALEIEPENREIKESLSSISHLI
ncbi:MAG: glycosyltransferase, partial [Candidatus Eremiobacterota bacterium]